MEQKQKKLFGLGFLKFVAMLMIVWWHIGRASGVIDWGARMCEFLFVASGFLVGYNFFYKKTESSWESSCDYTHKKVRTFWPLHVIALVLCMFINFGRYVAHFGWTDLPILLSNIFLLQAWSPNSNVYFSYNGITWFLSALIFCYFFTPFIVKIIKNKKLSIILFVIVAAIRFFIEFGIVNDVNIFQLRIHTSPIVRFLEYFMGMLIVPFYMSLKSRTKIVEEKRWFKLLWTFVEIALIVLIVFLMYTFNNTWMRAYFVYVFCVFIFFISMDCGYFSKFCSLKPVVYICSFQLEIYVFQNVVSGFVNLWGLNINFWALFSIKMALLVIVSALYKMFVEERIAKVMDKIYNKIKSWFHRENEQESKDETNVENKQIKN